MQSNIYKNWTIIIRIYHDQGKIYDSNFCCVCEREKKTLFLLTTEIPMNDTLETETYGILTIESGEGKV